MTSCTRNKQTNNQTDRQTDKQINRSKDSQRFGKDNNNNNNNNVLLTTFSQNTSSSAKSNKIDIDNMWTPQKFLPLPKSYCILLHSV